MNTTGADLEVHRVEDPSRNLSRTHFAIAWSGDVPAIVDQHSGNGTAIVRGDAELVAAPGSHCFCRTATTSDSAT